MGLLFRDEPIQARDEISADTGCFGGSAQYRFEAAEINGPVVCAGVQVRPGDLIIADDSGIVVIPLEKAEEVLKKARETVVKEEKVVEAVRRGATVAELKRILDPSRW